MSTIIWVVALYFIGRHWLKKNPDKATTLKSLLAQIQTRSANPARPAQPTTVKPQKQLASPSAHPVLKTTKKAEQQFREL